MISPKALESLAQVCHERGIKHLKTQEIELEIDLTVSTVASLPLHVPKPHHQAQAQIQEPALPALNPEQVKANQEATEQIKKLISTLKMSDTDLMDNLFPTGMPA